MRVILVSVIPVSECPYIRASVHHIHTSIHSYIDTSCPYTRVSVHRVHTSVDRIVISMRRIHLFELAICKRFTSPHWWLSLPLPHLANHFGAIRRIRYYIVLHQKIKLNFKLNAPALPAPLSCRSRLASHWLVILVMQSSQLQTAF